ncbi:MAG: phage tail protein, partial [Pseudomonadota bacterium]
MAGEEQDNSWPLPKFYFSVSIGDVGDTIPFQEVSGLDTEAQPIAYRAGDANTWSVVKMPGLIKTGNVMLKKGLFA